MTTLATAITAALLHFIWQGAVCALLLWFALAMLRNSSANTRYLASCCALAVMMALPVVNIASFSPKVSNHYSTSSWVSLALPVWAAGVLLLSIRWAWGLAQLNRLRRSGVPDPRLSQTAERIGLKKIKVLISNVADGPCVIGWITPVILVPAATLAGLTPQQLEAILAHEVAHILRHDYLINLIQTLAETLLFYHPAVWWVSSRIRHERELCCDDRAVRSCGDPVCYARALTALEKMRVAAPALAMGSTGSSLSCRVNRLFGAKPTVSRAPAVIAIALALGCSMISADTIAKPTKQQQFMNEQQAVVDAKVDRLMAARKAAKEPAKIKALDKQITEATVIAAELAKRIAETQK